MRCDRVAHEGELSTIDHATSVVSTVFGSLGCPTLGLFWAGAKKVRAKEQC